MIKKIGFAQFEVEFGERQANFARVDALLKNTDAVDLLVLPELAFTGYEFKDRAEVDSLAERCGDGPTTDFLRRIAQKINAVVVAGYAETDGSHYYNSAMMVLPGGETHNYRKVQLFSRENDLFSPGDAAPKAYDTPAGRIGMMICFDWYFPETARLLALDGAQIIAHPSNLVLPYCQKAMYARSVENHLFTITANRVGTESRTGRTLIFTGGSQVLDPDGQVLTLAPTEGGFLGITAADISKADNKQINQYNNLLSSRRTDLYGSLLAQDS